MNIIGWLATLESRFADWLGEREKRKLMRRYQDGLTGEVSKVFLTRGKRTDSFTNVKIKGYFSTKDLIEKHPEVYEVVYQCRLMPHEKFVLSLFEKHGDDNLTGQLEYIGKHIRITKYGCVVHPLHRFVIESNVEIYPQEIEIIF